MEFVVLLSLFAITLTQVMARPVDDTENLLETKTRNTAVQDGSEEFKFILPTVMRNKYAMNISGTLNMSDKNFIVTLPIEGESSKSCTVRFDYEKNSEIEVFPELETPKEKFTLRRGTEDPHFRLYLMAVEGELNFFEIIFTVVGIREAPLLNCEIESFKSLSHIVFTEGVKNIDSILFTF